MSAKRRWVPMRRMTLLNVSFLQLARLAVPAVVAGIEALSADVETSGKGDDHASVSSQP